METKLTPPLKWHDCSGFRGYQISREGHARRVWQSAMGWWNDRRLKPDVDRRGRRRFTLRLGGRSVKVLASRLVLEAFVGPCPPGMEACHDNGDCTDNRAENLRWDTHQANIDDKRRHGTNQRGESINTAKLTESLVREIRDAGGPLAPLARKYGVTETMISLILRRKAWKHVA